jgi:sulfur-carrier protein adenylyltransferase/sulfurtransferase
MKIKSGQKIANVALFIFIAIFLFSPATSSYGADDEIPRLTLEELKKMIDEKVEVTIIDVQPLNIYEKGHIKGAISIPWKSQLALEDVWAIPSGIPIVTYCACGPSESDSNDFAKQLMKMGYNDVKVLKHPAIQGWLKAGYPVEK